jgi:hypothetical protein
MYLSLNNKHVVLLQHCSLESAIEGENMKQKIVIRALHIIYKSDTTRSLKNSYSWCLWSEICIKLQGKDILFTFLSKSLFCFILAAIYVTRVQHKMENTNRNSNICHLQVTKPCLHKNYPVMITYPWRDWWNTEQNYVIFQSCSAAMKVHYSCHCTMNMWICGRDSAVASVVTNTDFIQIEHECLNLAILYLFYSVRCLIISKGV